MERYIIRLEDIRLYCYIGVSSQERKVGNDFRVDVSVETDARNFEYEKIRTTISYADIYDIVYHRMGEEWKLLESAAKGICNTIKSRWPDVLSVKVKITKLSPPLTGIQGVCSVEYCNTPDD